MARFALNTGLAAAFDAAARAYSADPTNDTKKTAATDAYALAYPTGGAFFAVGPSGTQYDDPDDITGSGEFSFAVRGADGGEVGLLYGSAYDVAALWRGLVAASYTPALVLAEEDPT